MALAKLTLHRTTPLEMTIEKPGYHRAFAFDVELALARLDSFVDPDSGMLVNLVDVDDLLMHLKNFWVREAAPTSMEELIEISLQKIQHELSEKFGSTSNLYVEKLCFHEKRGEFFGWRQGLICGSRRLQEVANKLYSVSAEFAWQDAVPDLQLAQLSAFADADTESFQRKIFFDNPCLLQISIEHLVTRERRAYKK